MAPRVYYYEDDRPKVMASLARYRFAVSYVHGKSVLDIGCGARKGPFLVSGEAEKVVGVDICEEAVGYCRNKWPSARVRYLAADAAALPFLRETFDCVLSFEVVEHLEKQAPFLREAQRVLKEQGVFIVSTPNRSVTSAAEGPQNPDHVHEFDFEEFRAYLGTFFSCRFYGQTPTPRIREIEESRRKSYEGVRRIPVGLRHLLPRRLREGLFRAYANVFSGVRASVTEYDITEEDFPVREGAVESASYLLAVCTK